MNSPIRTVRVNLPPEGGRDRAYDVVIGRGLLDAVAEHVRGLGLAGLGAVIFDEVLQDHVKILEHALRFTTISVPSGEASKSMEQLAEILSRLAQAKINRHSVVIALGGGVIGDLAGFAAAAYLRGVAFVQLPTTLLAMVDSSVGGKTGVNLPEGKNLVGAFHQPRLVLADIDLLATLPAHEFSRGMAEVIKYGAIADRDLFDRVARGVKPDDADLADIIARCVEIKARIVERDEYETKGERALLNFGHTLGHAIEKAGKYQTYLHGEAIALGMVAAARLSVSQLGLPAADADRIEAALAAHQLPVKLKPGLSAAALLPALGNDKKVAADGRNRWVLLDRLGHATSGHEIEPTEVAQAAARLEAGA
jgi:3-dehydroquinate synthase